MRILSCAKPKAALGCLATAAAVTFALAGCGNGAGQQGGTSVPGPGQAVASRPATTPAAPGSAVEQARTPRQHAEDDAAQILAAFVAPPGARRLQKAPASAAIAALSRPLQTPGTPNLIDLTSWWLVPGAPQSALGWAGRHLPHRFTLNGAATSDGPPGVSPAWASIFSLPAMAGVLDSRQLLIQVAGAGHNMTAIRVDAQVTWISARPASERVPSAAKVLRIAALHWKLG